MAAASPISGAENTASGNDQDRRTRARPGGGAAGSQLEVNIARAQIATPLTRVHFVSPTLNHSPLSG
jgi:hypothetical protein